MSKKLVMLAVLLCLTVNSSYGYMWWIIGPTMDTTKLIQNIMKKIESAGKTIVEKTHFIQDMQKMEEMYMMYQNAKKTYANLGKYVDRFKALAHKDWIGNFSGDWRDPSIFTRFGIQRDPDSPLAQLGKSVFDPLNQTMDETGKLLTTIDDVSLRTTLQHVAQGADRANQVAAIRAAAIATSLAQEQLALKRQENDEKDGSDADKTKTDASKAGHKLRMINSQLNGNDAVAQDYQTQNVQQKAFRDVLHKRTDAIQAEVDAQAVAGAFPDED